MKIAMLAPIAWRTPPRHYGPWESVVSLITEGLVQRGHEVTLFATGDSITRATLRSVVPKGYEEDPSMEVKVAECLHISSLFEQGDRFDVINNHFDFLPLTFSAMTKTPVVTTVHGFSSEKILPVYKKYNKRTHYVSISDSDRHPSLDYATTIHHGIDIKKFTFNAEADDYLVFFGRIHHDKGARDAIAIAERTGMRLVLAGIVQDQQYFDRYVAPKLCPGRIEYVGSVGPEARDALLGQAKALLHPIYFDEPFGLSVIESMACGTPVIAYDRGSMPELINDYVNGFLVTDVSSAAAAVENLDSLSRADCRTRVEKYFSQDRMVEDYEMLFRALSCEKPSTMNIAEPSLKSPALAVS